MPGDVEEEDDEFDEPSVGGDEVNEPGAGEDEVDEPSARKDEVDEPGAVIMQVQHMTAPIKWFVARAIILGLSRFVKVKINGVLQRSRKRLKRGCSKVAQK
ncbi:uncharacterized protein DS421_11g332040 [Arachis hypogaea]|nr:uncharacterized protein DS421_11g332040 [Arachis hypogaea]